MAVSSARGPLPPLVDEQARASDPRTHVWLAASAGTGKTQVLAARVYRLLLGGTDPGAILCLTFTKAGAAEMAGRIKQRLAAWVRASETDLGGDLIALGERPSPERIARARTLFAKVLDAPGGGLRIQTIHSFCQSLLAAFPVEAGLVPGFRPLEAREESQLAREALAGLLVDAEREGREEPVAAVGALSRALGEGGAEAFLAACAKAPEALAALPLGDGVQPYIRRALDLPSGDVEGAIAEGCGAIDEEGLRVLHDFNRGWGTKSGLERAGLIRDWLDLSPSERVTELETLHGVWAKRDGEVRSFGKGQAPQDPDYPLTANAFYDECAALLALRRQAAYADLLARGLSVGRDYAAAYRAAKRRAGAVDFDDLIRATVDLLRQEGIGDWIRYKLDQATEHVLIDEAQDTNAQQWAIVRSIVSEYFSGQGTRGDRTRTLFTVGDHKQAIFGFQGTDPAFFNAAEQLFTALAAVQSEIDEIEPVPFERLSLTASFRSTAPILEFVDAAIEALPGDGMGAVERELHASKVPGPGQVNLWAPTLPEEGGDDEEAWIADAVRAHAMRIARRVKAWLDPANPLMLESKGRRLRPEDVMILVKRRGELASLIVARLYAEGVPVAGVDRLRLTAPLAVQDLLAAIRFVLQPQDDLALASLLVSPLLGWSQDELMHAAMKRRGGLWAHLQATQPPDRLDPLNAMLRRADFTTPYVFLEELLTGPLGGRRKLIRRLGQEARDPIDELLNAALEFERVAIPSLQRFLDWFDRGDVEIVRDPSQPLDAVRVMTVHGAKGLQAPLVILADATADPDARPRSTMNWQVDEDVELPIFRPKKDQRTEALAAAIDQADARELAEHWRLFYVAATRAEERLEIAGALGPRAKGVPPDHSWYAVADAALTTLGAEPTDTARRSFAGHEPPAPVSAKPETKQVPERAALPAWVGEPAPAEARPPRPLAPSSLGEDDVPDPPPSPQVRAAAERGRLIHALFERLPAVAPDCRAAAAHKWLSTVGGVADAAARADIVATVCDVIGDPAHAALFGPDSLGEAPISAVVPGGYVIAGTVDRLLVETDRVRIVDFKTGRRVPLDLGEIPVFHLRQMAAYAAALRVIFPDRAVEAALLYTAAPRLFDLPADLLDRHKPGLGATEQS
ncbi:double-strand break repair helicase AddA [Sphingomonas sp.]|jgi:ATP-dependent helicase/nuclease subunit A|uniref:double-strand break repair helicase AddA n=1 Tax=Sphingomonas sp. TaxID=28214 RepID=UPI002E31A3BC|nr:double-strand break repair helicase AddA [Sphingomonas sp.]HEX4693823.1 double-strand break repair helicase AddA [Sphingomonas sp.]